MKQENKLSLEVRNSPAKAKVTAAIAPSPVPIAALPVQIPAGNDPVTNEPHDESKNPNPTSSYYATQLEAFRKQRKVPGVTTDFEKHRQTLAEASLSELRKLIDKEFSADSDVLNFLTDINCYRFLRARDGDANKALDMIRNTIKWRRKNNVLGTPCRCLICEDDPYAHSYFCIGLDIYDRAVMYSCSARASHLTDAENSTLHIVSEMDAFLNDHQGVAQIVWVVDFTGFKAKHSNPDLGRHAANLFQQIYPERLGQLVLLDFPWIFSLFLKIVSPLLDQVTRNKILVLRSADLQQEYFKKHWSPEMVEWINAIQLLPAVPGKEGFPVNSSIGSRYWKKT